jgi:hypothetical protein
MYKHDKNMYYMVDSYKYLGIIAPGKGKKR